MQKIKNITDLKIAITQTQNQQAADWVLLNRQIEVIRESLHPLQILKKSFAEVVSPSHGKNHLLHAVLGLTAGVLSKALVIGATHNPIKILFGALLQMKVSDTITKNAGTLGFIATSLLGLLNKKKQSENEAIERSSNSLKEIF